ncbi:TPA: arginase family protein [Vibrio diabolicus]
MQYTLTPGICLGRLGDQFFLYDKGLGSRRLLKQATQPISMRDRELIKALVDVDFPASAEELLQELAAQEFIQPDIAAMLSLGVLTEFKAQGLSSEAFVRGLYAERFELRDMQCKVSDGTLFNLPIDTGEAKPTVAVKGIPMASLCRNKGTESGPGYLRHITGTFANWFDIYRDGVFSDLCLGDGKPTIGQGVIAGDFGDIDFGDGRLETVFGSIASSVSQEFLSQGVKPVFIGGDHAVTFPIVQAMQHYLPDIGLLHLDAHHDAFFGDHIQYSHASVIANLLFHTGIDPVFSFGMRTRADFVGPQTNELLALPEARRWWRRISTINECRRYLFNPSLLDNLLQGYEDRPYFLTIDLDVLSPEAISGRVMTPVSDGLTWSEFFDLLEQLFKRLNIVGCDITELNPYMGSASEQTDEALCLLLIYLIEKLG